MAKMAIMSAANQTSMRSHRCSDMVVVKEEEGDGERSEDTAT